MRQACYLFTIILTIAALGLIIFAIIVPRWSKTSDNLTFGLWGERVCAGSTCYFTTYITERNKCKPHCSKSFNRHILGAYLAGGFLITASTLYFIHLMIALSKLSKKCCRRTNSPFFLVSLFASALGAVGWGLFFHFQTLGIKWSYCLWIALAGWIAGTLGSFCVIIYKLSNRGYKIF